MSLISPQHAVATADPSGDAAFVFPDVPLGQTWSGTTQIPSAPPGLVGKVYGGGELLGGVFGPGSYGPWTVSAPAVLSIVATGLTPDTQYEAVWHPDTQAVTTAVYPSPITPTVVAAVTVPVPLEVDGTVTADQGNPPWQVTVTGPDPLPVEVTAPDPLPVTSTPVLATGVASDQVTMTGSAVQLAHHTAVAGVVLSAAKANGASIEVGPSGVATGTGLILEPGEVSPLLPVTDSDDLWAIGTASDVLSFLVT